MIYCPPMDKHRPWALGLFILSATTLNLVFNAFNRAFESPLYFDSLWTATMTAVFGLWPGLVTAVLTQAGMEVLVTWDGAPGTSMPFVFCSIATVVIVWAVVATGKFDRAEWVLITAIAVALANSVIGSVVATFVFGGFTGHASDYVTNGLVAAGQSLLESTFWTRVPLNLIDKGIAVFVAYALWSGGKNVKTPSV